MAAGNAVIGALRVVLGADTAELETGLKSAQKKLGDFGSGFAKAAAAAGAAAAALGIGIAVAMKGTINEADKLGKTAQAIGIPVEELSKLKYAADLSDVSLEDLSKSARVLSKNMVAAAGDINGEAAQAFAALGISVRNADGSMKSVSQVMAEVSDKFAGAKDGAAKTAMAMQLMGKNGAAMIPMLNGGSAGLHEMFVEAEQLGIVLDTKTAKAAEAFNDNLRRLGVVKDAIILKLTAEMLPALGRFSQFMVDSAKKSDLVNRAAKLLTTVFDGLTRGLMLVYDNFSKLTAVMVAFVAVQISTALVSAVAGFVRLARAVQAAGLMMAAFEAIRKISTKGILLIAALIGLAAGVFDDFAAKLETVKEKIASALPEGTGKAFQSVVKALGFDLSALEADLKSWDAGEKPKKTLDDLAISGKNTKDALDKFIDSAGRRQAVMQAEIATVGMSVEEQEKYRFQLEASTIAEQNKTKILPALQAQIDKTASSLGAMAQRLEDTRNAWGFANQQLDRGSSVLADVALGAKKGKDAFKEFATSMLRDIAQLIAKFILLNTVIKPLFGGFLSGGGFGGMLGLSGLGFAQEGSFTVGGGSSMTDTAMVPMQLAAGERVTVDRPQSSSQARVVEIPVRGDFFSRETVRRLIAQINDAVGDGVVLKTT